MEQKQRSLAQLAGMQIVAGGSAGLSEVCLLYPLDVVKTRFQIQRGPDDPLRYKSLPDCFRTMIKKEGPMAFYKGILAPIAAETPKRAVKFFTFEQYRKVFTFGGAIPMPVTLTISGLASGLTEAIVINPFEVVKVKLQAERGSYAQQKTVWQAAREISRTGGWGTNGLNKGLTATLGRHGIFNMVYFSFYHNIKNAFPTPKDPRLDFAKRCGLGFMAGLLSSVVNIPWDVAKSRIQGPQPVAGQIKYKTCTGTMITVYKEEGYRALYKGLVPKIMRLAPGGAIMLVVYEEVYAKLQETF